MSEAITVPLDKSNEAHRVELRYRMSKQLSGHVIGLLGDVAAAKKSDRSGNLNFNLYPHLPMDVTDRWHKGDGGHTVDYKSREKIGSTFGRLAASVGNYNSQIIPTGLDMRTFQLRQDASEYDTLLLLHLRKEHRMKFRNAIAEVEPSRVHDDRMIYRDRRFADDNDNTIDSGIGSLFFIIRAAERSPSIESKSDMIRSVSDLHKHIAKKGQQEFAISAEPTLHDLDLRR